MELGTVSARVGVSYDSLRLSPCSGDLKFDKKLLMLIIVLPFSRPTYSALVLCTSAGSLFVRSYISPTVTTTHHVCSS